MVARLYLTPYTRRLRRPLLTNRGRIYERHFIGLEYIDKDNNRGISSAAPFALFGTESYKNCLSALENIHNDFDFDSLSNNTAPTAPTAPTAHMALDIARLYAKLAGKQQQATEYFRPELLHFEKPRHAYLAMRCHQQDIRQAYLNNAPALKCKVHPTQLSWFCDFIRRCDQEYSTRMPIRIDANGAFNKDCLKILYNHNNIINLDFIEQPYERDAESAAMHDNVQLSNFYKTTILPFAWDESLRGADDIQKLLTLHKQDNAVAIIKPCSFPSITALQKSLAQLKSNNWRIIISNLLEDNSSLDFYQHLIYANKLEHDIHGLGTADIFTDSLVHNIFPRWPSEKTPHWSNA